MHFYDAYKYGLTRKEQCGSGTIFLSFSHGGEGLGEEGNGPMSHNFKHPKKTQAVVPKISTVKLVSKLHFQILYRTISFHAHP